MVAIEASREHTIVYSEGLHLWFGVNDHRETVHAGRLLGPDEDGVVYRVAERSAGPDLDGDLWYALEPVSA